MEPCFFHIDVNSAFLSWTAIDMLSKGASLDIRTVPAIIGGDRESRHGIVLAKSIPAKAFGIQTGEPVAAALRKCPTLVIESPDTHVYHKCSHDMMDYLHTLTPDIEQASIDECYLDFAPIAHLYESPIAAASMIRDYIRNHFGFTVNVGISDRKVLAKMASDFRKPDLTHTLYSYEIQEKMWPLPVSDLFLCGHSSCEILHKLDILTIGQLATANPDILNAHLKSHGKILYEFANGIDSSGLTTVTPEAKGIGNSTTVSKDITRREDALKVLLSLSESVARRMLDANVVAYGLTVEIKYATFRSVSHQSTLLSPVASSAEIYEASVELFDSFWDTTPLRLLGIRSGKLVSREDPVQLSIFSIMKAAEPASVSTVNPEKQQRLEIALHDIRSRFGRNSVNRGTFVTLPESPKTSADSSKRSDLSQTIHKSKNRKP